MKKKKNYILINKMKNSSFYIGNALFIQVQEAVTSFNNPSKYLDQTHPT
jgi:hypothetical protein